jgi:hypothetical protein
MILRAESGVMGLAIDREGVSIVEQRPGRQTATLGSLGFLEVIGEINQSGTAYSVIHAELTWRSLQAAVQTWYGEVAGLEAGGGSPALDSPRSKNQN